MGYPWDNIPTLGQELACPESQHPDSGQDFVCPENLVELPATFCRLEDDGKNAERRMEAVLCHDNINMAVKLCHEERICIHCRQTEVELQKHSLADGSTAQASAVRPRPTKLDIFVCACRDGMY